MERQLDELNMRGTRFVVSLTPGAPSASGKDACAFLIAPNRGEKLQKLADTASGGELSRLMLAIKSIAAEQSLIPSMVFDEIDTGISGRTAQVVAEKMADIAKYRQVLCVTHLTQIAAMADRQYLVEKAFDGERTLTKITELDLPGRVAELSRMLGGVDAESESARAHARALLDQAAAYRKQ
jgi:DNA repair protein RecN (Recombination protein N)